MEKVLNEQFAQEFKNDFEGVEILEVNESKALSETAASSGISSCNSCSCCASTSCCSVSIFGF